MKRKTKILLLGICTLVLGLGLFNPNIFAESKKQLAQMVMEHEFKIANLEELVKNIGSGSGSEGNEEFTTEAKEVLVKEVERSLPNLDKYLDPDDPAGNLLKINVTNFEIKEIQGNVTLQLFTEGDYEWQQTIVEYPYGRVINDGGGRQFAQNFIRYFDAIPKMYGIDLKYEFYQNGERIRLFTNLDK